MIRVLVAFASKSGSTGEIAQFVGEELRCGGLTVDVREAGSVSSVEPYQAVVLGSAVYAARWRPEAVRFFRRFRPALAERPTWLFESGWVGDRPNPVTATPGARRRARQVGAEPPQVFGGRLDPELTTGFIDRLVARTLSGDSRDWDRITQWSRSVARALAVRPGGERDGYPVG